MGHRNREKTVAAQMIQKSEELIAAVERKNSEQMADISDELEEVFNKRFGFKLNHFEKIFAYFYAVLASAKYLAYNNFYSLTHDKCCEALDRYTGFENSDNYSAIQKQRIADIVNQIRQIVDSTPKKHKNLTLPRQDTRCCLCRTNPANKTGSHMVPNFLAHPTFSWDGKGKRFREALDHHFLNDFSKNCSFYGAEVPSQRIEKVLGHPMTDEEIENNINQLEFDNVFCSDCEKRFGVLETAYSQYYNGQKRTVSPRLSYLFWLSVLWRMAIGRMGIYLDFGDEQSLREILFEGIVDNDNDIAAQHTDLGTWQYAIFRANNLREGDKGILGYRKESAPYVVMYNDLYMVFYPDTPSDEYLRIGSIEVKRENLNDWHSQEKMMNVDREDFWKVRDFIDVTSYDYYDPPREQAMLVIREKERSSGRAFSQEAKETAIKVSRLSNPLPQNMLRIRKFGRIFASYIKKQEAEKKGEEYDPLDDEELFLNENDFQQYYSDIAAIAREGQANVEEFPYYAEAKSVLPEEVWQETPNNDDSKIEKEHSEALEWALQGMSSKEIKKIFVEKEEPVRTTKIGRNEPCPCGSGKKYKNCCGRK